MKQIEKPKPFVHRIDVGQIVTIDCGIGVIQYIQPDNLKLQMLMEVFKEQQEKIIYQ